MELEIVPPPTEGERAAIVAALESSPERLDGDPWWAAGLPREENGEDDL